ncbi:DUF6046 domain-containing protein [Flavobacterium maritimum]|uniref:DUF6046 domain-containing protein n=1 Tax=Flavobacterium maritimum TaxID=3149042 RepID=UPI0032B45057
MSSYNFNFQELFKSTFNLNIGYVGAAVADQYTNGFEGIQVLEEKKPLQLVSQTGVHVWDYVKLLPKIIEGTGERFDGYDFPFECVVEVVLTKKIAITDIFGADGEVEELMGLNDYGIVIKGIIINYKTDDYPEFEFRRLRYVCEIKDTMLEVEGTFLNMLNINHLSIHAFRPIATPGYKNMQAFEIECRSKRPFKINSVT